MKPYVTDLYSMSLNGIAIRYIRSNPLPTIAHSSPGLFHPLGRNPASICQLDPAIGGFTFGVDDSTVV